jgi:hypothetical protein
MSTRQQQLRANLTPAQQNFMSLVFERNLMEWVYYWGVFVMMVAVGSIIAGKHAIELKSLVLGLPIGWVTGWGQRRNNTIVMGIGLLVLFGGGITVGYLAP